MTFLYTVCILLVLAIPGAVFALVEWLIYRRNGRHNYVAAAFPYLFMLVLMLCYFSGKIMLHKSKGIDTIGSVREVPLLQQPWRLRLMNYDMHHGILEHPDKVYASGVVFIQDLNDSVLCFAVEGETVCVDDSVVEEHAVGDKGMICAGCSEIYWENDSVSFDIEDMTDVNSYYKSRYSDLTDIWLFCFFFFGLVAAVLCCFLLNHWANKRKLHE